MFKRATREKLLARIALDGPAGSGKSYTALRFGFALGQRVAVIDTEHRSASKYSGESPDGVPWAFDVCELEHYSPSTYKNVIEEAGRRGYDVIIIDSLSHAWEGKGGALDTVDRKASQTKGGSFSAWREVSPMHRDMVDAILAAPCHVIATMRSKTAYEVETDDRGKMRPVKIGTKPVQREGVEYEFDVVGDLDLEHIITISKTRCPAMDGQKATKPGPAFILPLVDWLALGSTPAVRPESSPEAITQPPRAGVKLSGQPTQDAYSQSVDDPCGDVIAQQIKEAAKAANVDPEKVKELAGRCGVSRLAEIPAKEAEQLLARLRAKASEAGAPF